MIKEIENSNGNICCFFGHRNLFATCIPTLEEEIKKLIVNYGVNEFYVGGYGDFDRLAAKTVNYIKKEYKNIKLFLIPAYFSTLENHKEYIYSTYDGTVFPDDVESVPQRFAITKRNQWMVNQCDYIIAYVKHYGSAETALKYAKRKNKNIINLALI